MRKVMMCFKMPHKSYVGGIATVMNGYISASGLFKNNEYSVQLFDYQNKLIEKVKPSFLKNVLDGIFQISKAVNIVKSSDIDLFHVHTSRRFLFYKDLLLLRAVKNNGAKHTLLSIHVGASATVFSKMPNWMQRLSIRLINDNVDKLIFLSHHIQSEFAKLGVIKEKTEVLYNFFDLQFESTIVKSNTSGKLRLLFMGMINRDKGIIELLTALQKMDDVPFVLNLCGTITDESIRSEFNEKCNALEDKICLRGYVTGEEKTSLLAESDIFILPSYNEGMPLVILEALAAGCGIVATPVGTTTEILNENNVSWVSVGSAVEIEEQIRKLHVNREMLSRMQKYNREKSKLFTKEIHINNLCGIYDSCN